MNPIITPPKSLNDLPSAWFKYLTGFLDGASSANLMSSAKNYRKAIKEISMNWVLANKCQALNVKIANDNTSLGSFLKPCGKRWFLTGDQAEYGGNPAIRIWQCAKGVLRQTSVPPNFFDKPIRHLTIDPCFEFLAAASSHAYGEIQIWDLQSIITHSKETEKLSPRSTARKCFALKPIVELKQLNTCIECMHISGNVLTLGCYSLVTATTSATVRFFDLNRKSLNESSQREVEAKDFAAVQLKNRGKPFWISGDSEINRTFVLSGLGDCLTIFDTAQRKEIASLKLPESRMQVTPQYDKKNRCLILAGPKGNEIALCDVVEGKLTRTICVDSDKDAEVRSLHFDAATRQLVVGVHPPEKAKVVIWDLDSNKEISSFYTLENDKYRALYHLDFDPDSNLLLIGGYGLVLWNVAEKKLAKVLAKYEDGMITSMQWNKQDRTILARTNQGTLYHLDYRELPVSTAAPTVQKK